MNDKEKDFEGPLKMENENLGAPEPVPMIDQSDIIGADATPEPFPEPPPKKKPAGEETEYIIDQADIISMDDVVNMEENLGTPSLPGGFATRSFEPGDVIFKEGDPGEEAYLILKGLVKISRQHKNKRVVVNQLGADQIFGEMAILAGEPRAATAEALEPTEVFVITEEKLNENLSQHLAIVKNLIDQLIERMKQLLQQQSAMLGKIERTAVVEKRVAKVKELAGQYEKTTTPEKMGKGVKALLKIIQEM